MSKKTKLFLLIGLSFFTLATVTLIIHVIKIHKKMEEVSESTVELSNANLIMDVPFEQKLPIKQGMLVEDQLKAHVKFNLSKVIHVKDSMLVQRRLKIPVEINVIDTIELKNHAIRISDSTLIYVLHDTIPIDQEMKVMIPGFKKRKIPILAKVPLNQTLYIKMNDELTTSAKIPINIPVKTEVDYFLNMMVPIEMDIPVDLPIDENLAITLQEPIKVNTQIPISTSVPVNIALKNTEMYAPLKKMSSKLKELSELIWPF